MKSNNKQIDAYIEERPLKFHKQRMLDLISEQIGDFEGTLLDIGCATGRFLDELRIRFPKGQFSGIDISSELVNIGRKRLRGTGIEIIQRDAFEFNPKDQYDVLIASGIMGVFDEPLTVVSKWVEWLKSTGKLFIFASFNSADVDVKIEFRNNFNSVEWETGYTKVSLRRFNKHLAGRGYYVNFEKFELPIDLPQHENPIHNFTRKMENGEK